MTLNKTKRQFHEYKKRIQAREKYISQFLKLNSIPKSELRLHHYNYRLFLFDKISRLNKHIGYRSKRDSLITNTYTN